MKKWQKDENEVEIIFWQRDTVNQIAPVSLSKSTQTGLILRLVMK